MGLFGFLTQYNADTCDVIIKVSPISRTLTIPRYLIEEAGIKNYFFCHFKNNGDIELIPMPLVDIIQNSADSEQRFNDLKDWVGKLQVNLSIASSF